MNDTLWYKLARTIVKAGGPPVPINETLIEILKTMVSEKYLEFLLSFRKISLNYDQIKEKTKLEDTTLKEMLNELMNIGLITGIPSRSTGIMVYRLVAFLPGLLEFSLMKGEKGVKEKKLAKLWDKLFEEMTEITQNNYELVMKAFKQAPPIDRVVPVEQEVNFEGDTTIPFEDVKEIVKKFELFGVSYCYCRHLKDLLNDPCKMNAPRKNCLSFGRSAKFAIDHGFATQITKEEVLRILKEAEDLGLVHKTFHVRADPKLEEMAICNCCPCCCGNFTGFYEGTHPTSTYSSYFSEINIDKCIGCRNCVELCPMDAIELKDSTAFIMEQRCIGCGLCAYHCPEGAIELKRTGLRKVFIPAPKKIA